MRHDNDRLKVKKSWQAASAETTYPIPETLDDLGVWVEQYFPDRLQLTRRAINASKKADYANIPLLYRSLILIATEYHDVLFGNKSDARETYNKKAAELKVEISRTFAGDKPTARPESYYVPWNDGKRLMDRHLQHGNSREPRYCLRVYFFADEVRQRIVIGHLPAHLPNSFT